MGTILTALGWTAVVVCGAVAVSAFPRTTAQLREFGATGTWITCLLFTIPVLVLLILLGVDKPLPTAVIAAVPAIVVAVAIWRRNDKPLWVLRWHVTDGFTGLAGDLGALWRYLLSHREDGQPKPARQSPATRPTADASRQVPSLREDPALAPVPDPAEAAAMAPVPAPWAELAGWVAGYIAEDDSAQSQFIHGTAAGLAALGQAYLTHAENATNEVGLDPSYAMAIIELAGMIAEHASDAALVDRRYLAIYGDLKRAVADGLILPYRSRDWFGDGENAA